jgi:osmotically-inducible protein OsmY
MRHNFIPLALLSILAFVAVQALSQQPQSQSPSTPGQAQPQAQQPAEAPPHVDQEPNPEDRALEQSIKDDLKKDEHMAYSNVRVHVTDTEIMLTGTVQTGTAKSQAAKIAGEHAGSRKIENHLKVNPNMHPGSGL